MLVCFTQKPEHLRPEGPINLIGQCSCDTTFDKDLRLALLRSSKKRKKFHLAKDFLPVTNADRSSMYYRLRILSEEGSDDMKQDFLNSIGSVADIQDARFKLWWCPRTDTWFTYNMFLSKNLAELLKNINWRNL